MTYRDMTFCTCWKRCAKGATCRRALTDAVVEQAVATEHTLVRGGRVIPMITTANFDSEPCFEPLRNDDRIFNLQGEP